MKSHPILNELIMNEDGTQIYFNGNPLDVKSYKAAGRNYSQKIVNFNSQTHTLIKLICETYNGEKPKLGMVVKRRDFNPDNDHYTNLYWAERGGCRTKKTKRVKNSKISENDIEVIIQRIEAGESLNVIAAAYNTSDMSIYRIKKNYILDKKAILKRAIMKAKDPYYKRLAFAKFFGFDSIAQAVDELGKNNFILQSQQIAL